jgi:hypothetical protein
MGVERAGTANERVPPDPLCELVLGEDTARLRREHKQEVELFAREREFGSVNSRYTRRGSTRSGPTTSTSSGSKSTGLEILCAAIEVTGAGQAPNTVALTTHERERAMELLRDPP